MSREAFKKWADANLAWDEIRGLYEGDAIAYEAWQARQPEIDALRAENDHLRASLANSGGACAYCNLPKEEWHECQSGFPGCSRADDAMLCPHVGLELQAQAEITALKAEVERLKK